VIKSKVVKLVLFLLGLVVLQQGIALGTQRFPALDRQLAVIAEKDIDPSALFYTESPLALAAEKNLRSKINSNQASTH
jgi:hypothetical protein